MSDDGGAWLMRADRVGVSRIGTGGRVSDDGGAWLMRADRVRVSRIGTGGRVGHDGGARLMRADRVRVSRKDTAPRWPREPESPCSRWLEACRVDQQRPRDAWAAAG